MELWVTFLHGFSAGSLETDKYKLVLGDGPAAGLGKTKKKSAAESSLIATIQQQLQRSKQTRPYLQVNKSTARSVCHGFFQSASNYKDQMIPDNTRRVDAKRNDRFNAAHLKQR